MLATQLNDMVTNDQIKTNAIIKLDEVICNVVQERRSQTHPPEKKAPNPMPWCSSNHRRIHSSSHHPYFVISSSWAHCLFRIIIILGMTIVEAAHDIKIGDPANVEQAMKSAGSAMAPAASGAAAPAPARNPYVKGNSPPARAVAQTGSSNCTPINGLNPYNNKWTIKAMVMKKGDIRTWSNARGEGKLFSFDVADDAVSCS